MSLDYVDEKLTVAVDTLATSSWPIQKRIADAWFSALQRLTEDDFPAESRGEFRSLQDEAKRRVDYKEMRAEMTDEEAEHHAERIVALFHLIRDLELDEV